MCSCFHTTVTWCCSVSVKIPEQVRKMMTEACLKERPEQKEISQLPKKTCMRAALTQDMFPPKTLKFRRGVRGIDWVICMCCRRSWNVSRNMCWWMCLWLGSQPVRARVGAGNALTASRLPAWHQNRWMPLIVTVCNVFNSIIPSLSLNLSIQHLSRSLAEAVCREPERSCIQRQQRKSWFYLSHQESLHFSWVEQLRYKVVNCYVIG